MTILGLAESFKTMNPPEPTVTPLTTYFSESKKYRDEKFCHKLHSNLQFVLMNFGIDILASLQTVHFSAM